MEISHHRQRLEVPAAVAVGAAASVLTLTLDRALPLPIVLSADNVRGLLAASFGALVTAGAFSFWMLPLAAQLAAASVPPPAVAGHLHDRFQRQVIAGTLGALAYIAIALLGLPAGDDAPAPTLATGVGALLGVGAIGMLLVAIQHAVRSTRPSVLLVEAVERVMTEIRRSPEPRTSSEEATPSWPERGSQRVALLAPATGWLQAVDDAALLGDLPERSTAVLDVGIGSFVVRDWTPVLTVQAPAGDPPAVVDPLGDHFDIVGERPAEQDLLGAVTEFGDIAVQASSGRSGAPSIVYEAIHYLGAILHELAHHDSGPVQRRSADGRTLLWTPDPSVPVLAGMVVDRIRLETAWHPAMALELVGVLTQARQHAAAAGQHELAAVLDEQADLVVSQCRRGDPLPRDLERVVARRASIAP